MPLRGAFAADKVCKVDIAGTDQMQFDKKEIAVAADCTEVEVTLKHVGKLPAQAMGHNWVLAKTADVAGVATDGIGRGLRQRSHQEGRHARDRAHQDRRRWSDDLGEVPDVGAQEGRGVHASSAPSPGHFALMKGTFKFG